MKNKLIPFSWLPGSWGLSGSSYARAEAEYYYEGSELKRKLCDIDFAEDPRLHALRIIELDLNEGLIEPYDADVRRLAVEGKQSDARALAKLDLTHGRIDQYTYDRKLVQMKSLSEQDMEIALLDVDLRHEKVDDTEYGKARACILNEPWIDIIDHGFDPKQGINGVYMEFDWNDQWIAFLRANGYRGASEEEMVERWFEDVNRSVEHDDGDGYDFVANSRRANRIDRGNGTADYT